MTLFKKTCLLPPPPTDEVLPDTEHYDQRVSPADIENLLDRYEPRTWEYVLMAIRAVWRWVTRRSEE